MEFTEQLYNAMLKLDPLADEVQNEIAPLSLVTDSMELAEQAQIYNYLDYFAERAEELQKMLKSMKDKVGEDISRTMEKSQLDKVTIHGFNWYPAVKTHASVKAENQPQFYAWLRDNNLGGVIKETVHPKTLESTVKELLDSGWSKNEGKPGEKVLPAFFNVFEKNTVRRIKEK